MVRPKTIRHCTLLLIGAVILQPLPPAKAIFTGIASYSVYVSLSLSFSDPICTVLRHLSPVGGQRWLVLVYDALVDLFASFEKFLSRLGIYSEIPLTEALKTILVEIIVELLSTLALATKQVKQGRFGEFILAGCYNT